MASAGIEWMVVADNGGRKVGALGFINNKVAIITSFYDDRDGNMDGALSLGERIAGFLPVGVSNRMVTTVAMLARADMDVLERDASFGQEAMGMFLSFAQDRITEGLYAVYFSRGVSALGTAIAQRAVTGLVKQFVVRKGFEKAVRAAYDAAMT